MGSKFVRVRFAPSPTGDLHIGLARTALFNWLFARKNNGVFILRIEDTDELRSTKESVLGILEGLDWLGINWDEGPLLCDDFINKQKGAYGPYFQMQRLQIYEDYSKKLIKDGHAYYCYCTEEELEEIRRKQILNKLPPGYTRKCRYLTDEKIKEYESEGRKKTIRFKMPESGKIMFQDLIHGTIEFDNSTIDDFIIMKSNGIPTYNFACVIDDHLMEITYVIRGDDHISNTPKQLHIYNAFGWESPKFVHLPMILGPDRTKLSKRHGAMSVLEYKRMGYVPEAVFNYLALLSWSTEDSQQIFGRDELIEKFSIERCKKSQAVFDIQKLQWMNAEYIKKMDIEKIYEYAKGFIKNDTGYIEYVKEAIKLEQEKIKLLSDIPHLIDFFLSEPNYNESAVKKYITEESKKILADITNITSNIDFKAEEIEKKFRDYAMKNGYKTSQVFHPVRVAVSGRMEGPGLFKMLELLGKEKVISRIKRVLEVY